MFHFGNDGGSGLDPGLQNALSQAMMSAGAGGPAGPASGQPLTMSDIEALLAGTSMAVGGRASQTTQKFVGPMPGWVPGRVRQYVQQGVVDPYLGTGQSAGEMRVYMGGRTTRAHTDTPARGFTGEAPAKKFKGGGAKERVDKTLTIQQATNEPYLWDENQVAEGIKKFQEAGVTGVTDFDSLSKAWGGLVQRAGTMYSLSSGKRKVTPWDALDIYKQEQIKAGTYKDPNAPGGANYTGGIAHVTRSVSDVSKGDAWQAMQTTVSNLLGHDPSDQEVRDFAYRMNHMAAKDPSISKTIEHFKNGQSTGTTTTSHEGFGASDLAQSAYQGAQADPDYAEYQSATTYFNAALSAMGAIGG